MSRSFSPPKRTAFFLLLSLAILLAVAVGFGPTFYLRSAFGTVDRFTGSASLSPHLAVHGVVLTAWFSLFAMQALLVKLGYARLHRRLGAAGLVLAGAAVASSAFTVHRAIPRAMEAAAAAGAPLDAAAQTAMLQRGAAVVVHDFWVLVAFVVLVGAAAYLRARPAAHKRLMLLGPALLVGPAFSTVRPIGRPWPPTSRAEFCRRRSSSHSASSPSSSTTSPRAAGSSARRSGEVRWRSQPLRYRRSCCAASPGTLLARWIAGLPG